MRYLPIFLVALVGCAPKVHTPTGNVAPPPALTKMRVAAALAPVQIVGPQDNVAVGWTEIGDWNRNHWYLIYIDGVQAPFGGTPVLQQGDTTGKNWQTPNKIYNFSVGNHTLEVKLVNHCEPNDPDPLCKGSGTPCSALIVDPCSEATGVQVISQDTPTGPQPPNVVIKVSQCNFTLSATPPDSTVGWTAQFKNGNTNAGSADYFAPYTRDVLFKPGVYTITVVWSKSGTTPVTSQPTTAECK